MPRTLPRTLRQPVLGSKSPARPLVLGPMERVIDILGALQRRESFTAATFGRKYEVSKLTIKRTLDMMRDRLGVPWQWDPNRNTYYLTRPCATLPLLRVEPREALALALAGRVFAQSHGPAFGRVLTDLLQKITPLFGGDVSLAVETAHEVITAPAANPSHALDAFFPLFDAIRERRVLRFNYTKPSSARPEKRTVHPLHLAELKSGWTLLAHDPARGRVRHFVLTRMQDIKPTDATFTPPPDFDAGKHLHGSMGSFAGEQEHEVRMALDAHAAFYAREQPWHHSQQLTPLPDGRVEMTLRITHLADARIAALRWGSHVEVLAPAELRDDVRKELQAALTRY